MTDLAPMRVAERIGRVEHALEDAGCDALVVTHLTNIRYLSGFTGSAGMLVLKGGHAPLLVTDGRYEEQATEQAAAAGTTVEVAVGRTLDAQRALIVDHLAQVARIGLEADHVSWADQGRFAAWFASAELCPTTGLVEDGRSCKDPGEVDRIEAACAIADAALDTVASLLDERPTEVELAHALDAEMRRRGAEDVSFPTIVATGPNGARPHHEPGAAVVERGHLVVIDFGALVDGYHSDVTRTIPVGGRGAIDGTQRRMLDVVTAAQAAGVAAVAAGRPIKDVDAACRAVIEEAGWGDAFVHGTGHGVGLDIHEAPGVSSSATATLLDGHVVTVEPGVYLPGRGGVRVEDTVLVTRDGCRPLTCAPKP
ncbi:MAG: M24 family metallopeptidase [Microthrixaceae bacterium]